MPSVTGGVPSGSAAVMVGYGMISELLFGFIGLLGALIGGGVTLLITRMNFAQDRESAFRLRRQHLADERRRACTTFLEHAEGFREQAWTLSVLLDQGAPAEQMARARTSYDAEWSSLKARSAGVQVAGPVELADASRALIAALGIYGQLLEDRAAAGPGASVRRGTDAALDDAVARRNEFVAVAQRAGAPEDDMFASAAHGKS